MTTRERREDAHKAMLYWVCMHVYVYTRMGLLNSLLPQLITGKKCYQPFHDAYPKAGVEKHHILTWKSLLYS